MNKKESIILSKRKKVSDVYTLQGLEGPTFQV